MHPLKSNVHMAARRCSMLNVLMWLRKVLQTLTCSTDVLQPQTAAMQSFADHIPMMPCDCNTQYCTCYSSNCFHVELCELDPIMLTSSSAQLSAHISGSTQNSQPFQHTQRRELRIFVMQQAALPTQYDKTAEMKHAVLNEAPPHDCLCSTVPGAMHH